MVAARLIPLCRLPSDLSAIHPLAPPVRKIDQAGTFRFAGYVQAGAMIESFFGDYGLMPLRPLSSTAPTAPAPTDSLAAAVAGMASPPPRLALRSKLEPDISLLIE